MLILVENRSDELNSLAAATPGDLSLPVKFGLEAGLYFEYLQRPQGSPSRRISGLNRHLGVALASRASQFQSTDPAAVVREALQENALLFNLDRAPTVALMGMEMLAEQLPDFAAVPDWQTCVAAMRAEIIKTDALSRRIYLRFLQEINPHLNTIALCHELSEIADEWDAFAAQLAQTLQDAAQLESSSRMLRRLAFREEHFWGNVLETANRK